MDKLRCLVIEDEPLSQDILSGYISSVPSLELIGICPNAIEATHILQETPVDLLFLDINLPKISGIKFLKALVKPPMTIFTTAYPEFAVEGFESDAVDYLLKPYSFERFLRAVNKAIERRMFFQGNQQVLKAAESKSQVPPGFLVLRADKRLHKVNLADIRYLEATGDYIKVFTNEKCLVIHSTIKAILEQLPGEYFIRIHKSFIIPLHCISYLEGNQVKIGDTMVPIGLIYKEELMKSLNLISGLPGKVE
jgi:DNA-binding LytR/AlgR family response regulator